MSSDINWPVGMPRIQDTPSGEPVAPVLALPMENGFVRQRRRFTGFRMTWSVSWLFTMDQYTTFLAFWDAEIACGTTYFNIDLPINGGMVSQCVSFLKPFAFQYKPHENMMISGVLGTEPVTSGGSTWMYLWNLTGGDMSAYLDLAADWDDLINNILPNSLPE